MKTVLYRLKSQEWFCPNCDDLIPDSDKRIEHLISRHNVSVNILEQAGFAMEVKKE